MYDKRIKIFMAFSALLLLVCMARLAQMQLLPGSSVQSEIAQLRAQGQSTRQLQTVRGKILDRNSNILATDEARFHLCIRYELSSILDDRVRKARLLRAERRSVRRGAESPVIRERELLDARLDELEQVLAKCEKFGVERMELEQEIREINNTIWNTRAFLAWWRNYPDQQRRTLYGSIGAIPVDVAMRDFVQKQPDNDKRILLTTEVDIPKMDKEYPLFELRTDDDVFTAQLEFMDIAGIEIQAQGRRVYPFGSAACQTIGWVGPATQETDRLAFDPNDRLSHYLVGEVCGREDGVEYVCEAILRGRRGELVYDIDRQLIRRTETTFGGNVQLTLDIELQQQIEQYLTEYEHEPGCGPGMAAIVMDSASNEILALASLPVYDLNVVRRSYGKLVNDPNKPLINQTVNRWYPPGSVVKPLTLIIGMETGHITSGEVINCPARKAPQYWPNCWIFNEYGVGHDSSWQNNARNAIKGSCNIYFSHLADRVKPRTLQRWLFDFGYGRPLLDCPDSIDHTQFARDFRELPGMISSENPDGTVEDFNDIPPLAGSERRWFGMGQGKLLTTPLQVANAMAAIERGGVFYYPRLFTADRTAAIEGTNLGISAHTMATVLDGMHAVVNEPQGTAYKMFQPALSRFSQEKVEVYGKTGSTQPAHAWFAGFARDNADRSIAVAVVVEGGQHGSSDAAPLARDIIQFCVEAGYVGTPVVEESVANPDS